MIDRKKTACARARWDRNARFYDFMSRLMDSKRAGSWYERLWGNVTGREVLEVGVGTGRNLARYPRGASVTAIDLSENMLERARRKAGESGAAVRLMHMDVQALEFPDSTFDSVVAACTFCSVPDPVLGLREVRRVLKPGGRLVLLEHMRHDNPVLGKLMDFASVFTVLLMGPALNRRTLDNVRRAGFGVEMVEDLALGGILKLIVAVPSDKG